MANRVFADELRLPAGILDIEPHDPGGELIAQTAFGRIAELIDCGGADWTFRGLHPAEPDFVTMLSRGTVDIEETDLLGLQVGNRGAFTQRIEVIVTQPFAGTAFGPGFNHTLAIATGVIGAAIIPAVLPQHPGIARHQHGLGIFVGGARIVGQGNPALNVDRSGLVVIQRNIVRPPAKPRGQIA